MKLMVAGCSYSAVSPRAVGTAWSEVLAHKLGWELENLARWGCSNGGIRIQIDEILRQRPDFAIITPTFWDRMEIPAAAAPFDWEKNCNGWNPEIQQHLQNRTLKNGYDRKDGIDNVNYGRNNYNMICETIYTLAENVDHPYRSGTVSKTTQTAIRHWIDGIYDSAWKKQQDEWIIKSGIYELYHAGIDFLFVPVLLWPWDPALGQRQWQTVISDTVPSRHVMSNEPESVLPITGNDPFVGEDPGYHSGPAAQQKIADNYYGRISRDFGLV